MYRLSARNLLAAEASSSLDIREDGIIDCLTVDSAMIDPASQNVGQWEFSFSSNTSWDTNDTKAVIATGATVTDSTLGTGAFSQRSSESIGVEVYAGERLYLHTKNSATPVAWNLELLFCVSPKGSRGGTRDSRGRYSRRGG